MLGVGGGLRVGVGEEGILKFFGHLGWERCRLGWSAVPSSLGHDYWLMRQWDVCEFEASEGMVARWSACGPISRLLARCHDNS